MELLEHLEAGRAEANARMTETISAGSFVDSTDENGNLVSTLDATVYTGPGRIKYTSGDVTDRDGPGQPMQVQMPVLSVPTGSPLIPEGTEVHVTASLVDDLLVGTHYVVDGKPESGQTTAHRYPLKEVS